MQRQDGTGPSLHRQGGLLEANPIPPDQGPFPGTEPKPALGILGQGDDHPGPPGLRQGHPLEAFPALSEKALVRARQQVPLPGLDQAMDVLIFEPLLQAETDHLPPADPGQAHLGAGDPDRTLAVLQQAVDVLGPQPVRGIEQLSAIRSQAGQAVAGAGPDEPVAVLQQGFHLALGQAIPIVEMAHGQGLALEWQRHPQQPEDEREPTPKDKAPALPLRRQTSPHPASILPVAITKR